MDAIYLVLTDQNSIPMEFDDYCIAGDYCVNAIRSCCTQNKSFKIINKCCESEQDINNTLDYLSNVVENVITLLSKELNEYLITSYSRDDWYFLIGYWVIIYVQNLYEKYLVLNKIIDTEEKYLFDAYETSFDSYVLDYAEFYNLVGNDDDYNRYIFSQLISVLPKNRKGCLQENCVSKFNIEANNREELQKIKSKTGIYRFVLRAFKTITKRQDKVIFWHCHFPMKYIFSLMRRKPGIITNYIGNWYTSDRRKLEYKPDIEWRCNAVNISTGDEFTDCCIKLLKKFIPLSFAEQFNVLRRMANKTYKFAQQPNAVFYSCVEGNVDETFKVYLMGLDKRKVRFCDVQHGGNYHIDRILGLDYEINKAGTFYSWGWKSAQNTNINVHPMPVSKLIELPKFSVNNNGKILYVNYLYPKYTSEITFRTVFQHQMLNSEMDFIKNINELFGKRLSVRLYPHDYGLKFKEDLMREVPELSYDTIPSFYDSLLDASLVIISDWSTTVLEALCMGIPIVAYRRNATVEEAQDDMLSLRQAGILYESWDEMKEALHIICRDVNKWWMNAERRDIVNAFKDKYCFMNSNPTESWDFEILKYCK